MFLKEENAMFHKKPGFRSPSYTIFILIVVSALLLASCAKKPAVVAATPTHSAATPTPLAAVATPVTGLPSPMPVVHTATPIVPTATPVLALDTPTPVLASNPQPLNQSAVATLEPTSTTSSLATPTLQVQVQAAVVSSVPTMMGTFALIPGTTAGVIQGTVAPHQVLAYTMNAGQAQPLTLIMESPNYDVTLGVFNPSSIALLDPALKLRAWQMALPTAGQYTIQVIGGATTESFTLTIKLPLPVYFGSGATSASLTGSTVNGYLFGYALQCAEGQTLSAVLNQPPSVATIDIYGLNTGTILEVASNVSSWSGILPQTQNYVVEVIPTGNQVVNYGLTLSCTGTPGTVYNPPPPVNNGSSSGGSIYFAPNTTAAVMNGTISPGQVFAFTVQASKNQALTFKVEATNKDVTLMVLDPSGGQVFDPAKLYANWQMTVHQTGLYTVKVVGGAYTEAYTLTVKRANMVVIPSDTHTITVYGTNHGGYIQSYSVFLSQGDTLRVSLDVPSTKAYLDVYGIITGSVLSYSSHLSSWKGTMPATQEYVIEVIPTGGYLASYGLTISNK
jgi:hypothetical protein